MKKHATVADYIESQEAWKTELLFLRQICLESEMDETLKWGIPVYTINKKNVVGIAAFKNHVAMWFYQGVFLKDPQKVLINAQEGTTKGMYQWRFTSVNEMDADLISAYIKEAIANEKAGKRIKIERNKKLVLPEELKQELDESPELKASFRKLTPFKQREYADHIGSAKREETRRKRMQKSRELILKGVGLNDKYR